MLKQTKIKIEGMTCDLLYSTDILDTNMALFGTPLEKEIKKRAAEGEPAWRTAGKKVGLEVWRVEQFIIKEWPAERIGEVYNGDSYIFLRTYKVEDTLKWDVHFWLGKYTSQDEAGTAAYKTVELDDYLGGAPVQYREVQGFESEAFLSLFPHGLKVLKGGVASGFKHVSEVEYEPRLLHVKGKMNKTVVRRVKLSSDSLNEGDIFLLDLGKTLYQFNGRQAGIGEKSKAAQLTRSIDDERGSTVEIKIITSDDNDDKFWSVLGGKKAIKSAAEGGSDTDLAEKKALWKLTDETGKIQFFQVPVARKNLENDEVFIFDCVSVIWIWVGKDASVQEKKQALFHATQYLKEHPEKPASTPIIRVLQGGENEEFEASWH